MAGFGSRTFRSPGLSTSDATATASDIGSGKTAYAQGAKVTGNASIVEPYTKVLFHFEGNNNSKKLAGADGYGLTPINGTGANLSTAQKKFGSSSLYGGNGAGAASLGIADAVNFGTGDFTIDYWVNYTSVGYPDCGMGDPNGTRGAFIGGRYLTFWWKNNGATRCKYEKSGLSWNTGQWYHIAFVRSGTNFYVFRDGVEVAPTVTTAISTNSLDVEDGFSVDFAIWGNPLSSGAGYIDEFRISKGIARWTANFTPPAAPY